MTREPTFLGFFGFGVTMRDGVMGGSVLGDEFKYKPTGSHHERKRMTRALLLPTKGVRLLAGDHVSFVIKNCRSILFKEIVRIIDDGSATRPGRRSQIYITDNTSLS